MSSELIIFFISSAAILIAWFFKPKEVIKIFKKLKIKFLPVKFNIAISMQHGEDGISKGYFLQILKNLKNTLIKEGFNDSIKIENISDTHVFLNQEEAEKFTKKQNIYLLIWGNLSENNLTRDSKKINKPVIYYTYACINNIENNLKNIISLDINSRITKKMPCIIKENDSFDDVDKNANNIFDMSLYIIALALKMRLELEKSEALFTKLFNKLKKEEDLFIEYVNFHLINIYENFIIKYAFTRKYDLLFKYSNKAVCLGCKTIFTLSNLALAQYKIGKENEARSTLMDMQRISNNNPATILNVAFFKIKDKKYNKACHEYEKLFKFKAEEMEFSITSVVGFLDNEFKETKESALLYASGIVYFLFGDKKIAKQDLKKFMKATNGDKKYRKMFNKAKKLIQQSS